MAAARRTSAEGTSGAATMAAIRAAAVDLFWTKGYEAATMRELAARVGIEAGSLYNHFPSKQRLLADILISTMEALLGQVEATLEDVRDANAATRLRAAIRAYVTFHDRYLVEAALTDTERRSLSGGDSERLLELRRRLADRFRELIDAGVADGTFHVEDAGISTLAVLSVCARLPVWFRPEGRLDLDPVADLLATFCLSALGAD